MRTPPNDDQTKDGSPASVEAGDRIYQINGNNIVFSGVFNKLLFHFSGGKEVGERVVNPRRKQRPSSTAPLLSIMLKKRSSIYNRTLSDGREGEKEKESEACFAVVDYKGVDLGKQIGIHLPQRLDLL